MLRGNSAVVRPALLGHGVKTGTLTAELVRSGALCRAWSRSVSEAHGGDITGLFKRRTLEAFGGRVRPGNNFHPPFDRPLGKLDCAEAELAHTIGEDTATLPLAEGLYVVTSLYPARLPEKTKG